MQWKRGELGLLQWLRSARLATSAPTRSWEKCWGLGRLAASATGCRAQAGLGAPVPLLHSCSTLGP